MKEIEPGYKCPCSQTVLCRLRVLEDELKSEDSVYIRFVRIYCFGHGLLDFSISRRLFMNVNVHILNNVWEPQIFTLSMQEHSERHTAENLANSLQNVAAEWKIDTKIVSIHDNASNIVVAVNNMVNIESSSSCAAHDQFNRNALKEDNISIVLVKGSKIVSHFHHSVITSQALVKRQQLDLLQRN